MIAMQYSFTLPADYDMTIVDERIASRGHLLDGFPLLHFKAYLAARRSPGDPSRPENLYAPFYVWDSGDGLSNFVCGDGFATLTKAFGWPEVKTWIVWRATQSPLIANARFATRQILPIAPYADLGELRKRESEAVDADLTQSGALAAVAGFELTRWTHVRFRLWAEQPAELPTGTLLYTVGHLSLPNGA